MKVAFYNAEYGRFWDKLVAKWTRGRYSHVELIFDNGLAYSSSPRDAGTRFAKIDLDSPHWDYIDIKDEYINKDVAFLIAEEHQDKKYDWAGILGFVFIKRWGRQKKWYCSEIVAHILRKSSEKYHFLPKRITPNKLYKLLTLVNASH